jgi:hypothetical protein
MAHRCFGAQETEATKTRRTHDLWLRIGPERACKAGRADALAYLYARKRVPNTIHLYAQSIDSGSVNVVRLARKHWSGETVYWNDSKALERALDKGYMDIVWYLIEECPRIDFRALINKAIRLRRAEVIDWLIATRHPRWDASFALGAAADCGNLEMVTMLASAPGAPLQDALTGASRRDHVEVVCFLLDFAPQLDPERALQAATGSVGVMRLLLERYPNLDASHLLDDSSISLEVARFLHGAYPDRRLQRFLENAKSVDDASFACENDPHLDLQAGLDVAATKGRFLIVRYLYARDSRLDLDGAVGSAARMKSTDAIEMLYAMDPTIDLQRVLDLSRWPSFAHRLCLAHPDLSVDALIAKCGHTEEWAFLHDLLSWRTH